MQYGCARDVVAGRGDLPTPRTIEQVQAAMRKQASWRNRQADITVATDSAAGLFGQMVPLKYGFHGSLDSCGSLSSLVSLRWNGSLPYCGSLCLHGSLMYFGSLSPVGSFCDSGSLAHAGSISNQLCQRPPFLRLVSFFLTAPQPSKRQQREATRFAAGVQLEFDFMKGKVISSQWLSNPLIFNGESPTYCAPV
jgi:hypothetical protein